MGFLRRHPDPELLLELDATDPPELVRLKTPQDLWLRVSGDAPNGWPTVQLRGPRSVVLEFVRDNWGDEVVEDITS